MSYIFYYSSPLGKITMYEHDKKLCGLYLEGQSISHKINPTDIIEKSTPLFECTSKWLDIYFSGHNPGFTPDLYLDSTPFRMDVWKLLLEIPYGQTISYKELAEKLAEMYSISKMSAQAVGGAVGHNPISIIIPCHRVIGSDGSLTGYAGGIDKKARLLTLEGQILPPNQISKA